MDGRCFRDLVSERQRGIGPALLRTLLTVLEGPYFGMTSLRNFCYDTGILKTHRLPIPIVSVGNLTLGGTGKSPMVAWLARWFLEQNLRPGLISRGYGSLAGNEAAEGVNDEYLELAFRLPMVPHRQNRDRVAAAMEFLTGKETRPVDVLVLDDAFQHRRIGRNLDIVLLDASEPFGFDRIFPRGTLRESVAGLRRAGIVLLSRADLISAEEREGIRRRVSSLAPDAVWGEVVHRPKSLVSIDKTESDLVEIHGKRVLAFCGIGNPEAFRKTLEFLGAEVAELTAFPDHYRYTPDDLNRLEAAARQLDVEAVLCTMKDLVKIDRPTLADLPIRAVSIDIEFLAGENFVRKRLSAIVDDEIVNRP